MHLTAACFWTRDRKLRWSADRLFPVPSEAHTRDTIYESEGSRQVRSCRAAVPSMHFIAMRDVGGGEDVGSARRTNLEAKGTDQGSMQSQRRLESNQPQTNLEPSTSHSLDSATDGPIITFQCNTSRDSSTNNSCCTIRRHLVVGLLDHQPTLISTPVASKNMIKCPASVPPPR